MRRAALAALLVGCSRPTPPQPASPPPQPASTQAAAPAPAPVPTSAPTPAASPAPAPATTPAPAAAAPAALALPVTAASASSRGVAQPLARAEATLVDPAAEFHVEVAVPLRDARLVLLDEAGAMVAASGGAELGASWTRFSLAPESPLVPGSTYSLRLDGAVERSAHDAEGRAYEPCAWPLRTPGEKPRPEPKRRGPRRR